MFWKRFIAIVALTTLVNACKSTKDYAQFGETGQAYAQAINMLIDATEKVSIDSSSETMLRDRRDDETSRRTEYEQTKTVDTEWLDLLSQMQAHTNLLAQYFERLQALATSDAPERAQDETSKLVTNLDSLGQKIRSNGFIRNQGGVIPKIVNIAVTAQIRNSLKNELKVRQFMIQRELDTQDQVLALIAQELKTKLKILQNNQEQRLVYIPYVKNPQVDSPDEFINNRRRILSLSSTISELEQATKVSEELKNSFLDLLDGKLTYARVNTLLSDIKALLEVAQNLKV